MENQFKEFKLPEPLQHLPRWQKFVLVASLVFFITTCTVALGALLGYTYCHIEHRNKGNISHSTNLQVIHIPYPDTPGAQYNRTINGALAGMSKLMMSRILKIGEDVWNSDLGDTTL